MISGLASQISQWRVDEARRRFGPQMVIYAGIQSGNTGSILVAQKWCSQFIEDVTQLIPANTTARPGRSPG